MRVASALIVLAAAPAAHAGETACWVDRGVLVVPAEVMGVAGDFILDTATSATQLGDTQAQGAGFTGTSLRGPVRLAGVTLADRPVQVAKLDLRTGAMPTPVAGVIGADVLKGFVVDVRFAPCRVAIHRPGRAPRLRAHAVLAIRWRGGAPVAEAAVSDGPRAWAGDFALATGSDAAVRLSDAYAAAPGAAKPQELYPYGVLRPKLAALSFAGALFRDVPAGLVKAGDPALAGQIGAPVLARWRLRFDFPQAKLLLAPNSPLPPRAKRAESGEDQGEGRLGASGGTAVQP